LGLAHTYYCFGSIAYRAGDYVEARRLHEQSLALWREVGNWTGIAHSLSLLGLIADAEGRPETARALFEENLSISRTIDREQGIALSLRGLGLLALDAGAYAQAAQHFASCLSIWRKLGRQQFLVTALEAVAYLAAAQRQPVRTLCLLGAAEAIREAIGVPVPPAERVRLERWTTRARADVDEVAGHLAWATGRALRLDQAIAEALQAPTALPEAGLTPVVGPPIAPHNPSLSRVAQLSEREREVLRLVASGQTNPEIAATLTLSRYTIMRHLSNIYTKLGVSSRAAAVAMALQPAAGPASTRSEPLMAQMSHE
jgi:DNA-binding CsgD family transcriptional regulator